MTDLPQDLQDLYDHLAYVLRASTSPADAAECMDALNALVAPYRTAQKAYAGSHGVYVVGPAYLVRIEGQRAEGSKGKQGWHVWPDDRPMPSLMDLLVLVHEKNTDDPATIQEDA